MSSYETNVVYYFLSPLETQGEYTVNTEDL